MEAFKKHPMVAHISLEENQEEENTGVNKGKEVREGHPRRNYSMTQWTARFANSNQMVLKNIFTPLFSRVGMEMNQNLGYGPTKTEIDKVYLRVHALLICIPWKQQVTPVSHVLLPGTPVDWTGWMWCVTGGLNYNPSPHILTFCSPRWVDTPKKPQFRIFED